MTARHVTRFRKAVAGSFFRVGYYGRGGAGTVDPEKFCVQYQNNPTTAEPPKSATPPTAPTGATPATPPAMAACGSAGGIHNPPVPPGGAPPPPAPRQRPRPAPEPPPEGTPPPPTP